MEPENPNNMGQVQNPLHAALKHHKQSLNREMGPHEDPNEIARLERTIGKIEEDIQRMNPSAVPSQQAPDKPQLSPEAQARQTTADKEVMDGIARHDAIQRSENEDQVGLLDPADDFEGENWDDY